MKLWELVYINNGIEGKATVSANTANQASVILQSSGRLNANKYEVNSITCVGCTETPNSIISEFYAEKAKEASCDTNIDINKLTEEDIKKLKLRLDKYSKILFVDKMGTTLRPKAHVGYSVLYISEGRGNSSINIELLGRPLEYLHVYIKTENGYADAGIPLKYNCVRSSAREVVIAYDIISNHPYIAKKIWLQLPKLGIFYLKKRKKNKLNREKGISNARKRWKFLKVVADVTEYLKLLNDRSFIENPRSGYPRKLILVSNITNDKITGKIFALGYINRSRRKSRRGLPYNYNPSIPFIDDYRYITRLKGSPIRVDTVYVR